MTTTTLTTTIKLQLGVVNLLSVLQGAGVKAELLFLKRAGGDLEGPQLLVHWTVTVALAVAVAVALVLVTLGGLGAAAVAGGGLELLHA